MASERRHLTDAWLEKQAAQSGRRHIYDTALRSFGATIHPSGKKVFFLFRRVHGRPRRIRIGTFPSLPVHVARAEASKKIALIEEGRDPLEHRHAQTVDDLFNGYLDRHLRVYAKNPDRAMYQAKWLFKFLEPWKGRRAVSIRRGHVAELHAAVGKESGEYAANRVLQLTRSLFNWAIRSELFAGENPASNLALFHEAKRTRFLQKDECPKFFAALRDEPNRDLSDYVWLALMTGARRGDILAMRWADLSIEKHDIDGVATETGTWTIPDPKAREVYAVALMPEAIKVLKARRASSTSEWVFPGDGKSGHLVEVKKAWEQFRTRAGLGDLRMHDLRRSLGSWMAANGASLPEIQKTLGHRSYASTQIYAVLDVNAIRPAVEGATRAMMAAGKKRIPPPALPAAPRRRRG